MKTITLLLLALAIYGTTVQSMTQELRQFALKLHNDYRKNVTGACQMQRMEYDMDLERQAVAWANKCVFKHELIHGRGENLAWNSAKSPETELMTNAAKSWYDEVNMYSYGQPSCGSSCHYTQMVWDKTNKVGCATKRCSYLVNAYADAWYFVCFYTPAGNMDGEKPYQTSCESPCIEGQTQDSDGLCVGPNAGTVSDEPETNEGNGEEQEGGAEEGTTDEGNGEKQEGGAEEGTTDEGNGEEQEGGAEEETTEEECEDKDSRCEGWAKVGECTKNPKYMHKDCKLACALCGDGTATGGGGNTGGGTESSSGGDNKKTEPCVDKDRSCPGWSEDGECKKNPGYMLENCKKSCKVCVSEGGTDENTGGRDGGKDKEEPCVDKNRQCPTWASDNQCQRNPGYMLKNCKKSCKVCGGGTGEEETDGSEKEKEPCVDKDTRCPNWAKGKQCSKNPDYMLKNCMKSCKVCGKCDYIFEVSEGGEENTNEGNTGGNEEEKKEEEPCEDKETGCVGWSKSGECKKNPGYMLRNCRKSCRVCTVKGEEGEDKGENEDKKETPAGENEDGSQGDQAYEDKGNGCGDEKKETKTKSKEEGNDNKETIGKEGTRGNEESKNEKQTDNKGDNKDKEEPKESCPEDNKKCRYWKKRKLCTKNQKFMERRCKRACGFCTA